MSTHNKLKEKLLSKPYPSDITFDELDGFLKREGFTCERARGSHFMYAHGDLPQILCIPRANPVKAAYIKQVAQAVEIIENRER